MIVVLGCLMNETGKLIKEEMLSILKKEHDVFCVEQEPPGKLFEYPAIHTAAKMSVEMNEPVLYLHTKGSGNKIPNYLFNKFPGKESIADLKPEMAKLEDWQGSVRKLWYNEFTGERLKEYINNLKMNIPMVICPFSGKGKATWQNGFIINPKAGEILLKELKQTSNRDYFEHIFQNLDVEVKGMIFNDINYPLDINIYKMRKFIWNYWCK